MKIKYKKKSQATKILRFLFLIVISQLAILSAMAQQKTITGTVHDPSKEPITGVSVVLKGTKAGTVTDASGHFSISVPNSEAVLAFSFLGYTTKEVTVGNQATLNITMSENETLIDEVIVVAYGTAKRSTYTGSAATVSTDKMEKISGSGFAEALQGMATGVNVVNNEGNPGGDTRITIRGIGSLNKGSSKSDLSTNPLIVVDGMPYDGQLNSISPSDIESMSVLKDAAAASLYGSRAAQGVVMVTTKKGKSGKAQVNFRSSWGTQDNAVSMPTKADPYQQLQYTWEGMYNDQFYKYKKSDAEAREWASQNVVSKILKKTNDSHGNPIYVSPFKYIDDYYVLPSGEINPNLQMVWKPKDYDIYGAIYSYKLRQDYSLDVSGATNDGKTNYFFSGTYLDDDGYALSQYFKRYSFRANVSSKVTNWLELGANVSTSNSRQNNSGFNRAAIFCTSMWSPWLRNADNTDWVYSEKTGVRMFDFGTYVNNFFGIQPLSASGDYWNNPNDYDFHDKAAGLTSSRFYGEIKLPFNLKLRSNVSVDNNTSTYFDYSSAVHGAEQLPPYGVTVKTSGGDATRQSYNTTSITWNNLLSYEKKIGDHSINALIGQEFYRYDELFNYGYGAGIMQLGQYELASTTRDWSVDSHHDRYTLLSFLGKADYGFKDRYYLSGSMRRDGSSRFSPDRRWGNFYSGGASWRATEEDFMKEFTWLNNLLIRGSYGTSGNDNIGNYYAYQGTFKSDNLYNEPGLMPHTLPTPNLIWEKNIQFNMAADFKLLNIFTGTIEYYKRSSKDLLYQKPLPLSFQSGDANNINSNLGNIENSGFEITLGTSIIDKKDFKWNVDVNWSSMKNVVTYLPGGAFTWADRGATYKMEEGHSLYSFFMPSFAGVDPQTGNALYYKIGKDGKKTTTDNFNSITMDDYEYQGSSLPKGYGALTNNMKYKGFDFSFMFYYSYGAKMYDYEYIERTTLRGGVGVIPDLVQDRWRKPGDIAKFPRWSNDDYSSTRKSTNFYLFNNDYIRLRNVMLGYTLPQSIVKKAKLSNVRLYVSGDNLLTFGSAKNRHSDPETGVSGNNYNGNSYTDNGYISSRRVYMGGLQVSF